MKRILETLTCLEGWLALVQKVVLALSVGLIVVLIVLGIFLRVVLQSPLFGVEEIALIAGMWLYLIGAAYCTRERSHIQASMVHLLLKNPLHQAMVRCLASGISVFLALVMAKWGYDFVAWGLTHRSITPSLGINYLVPQSALFAGAVLMVLYFALELADNVRSAAGIAAGRGEGGSC
ncbi:TRAP transporter small permease [Desulfocurvus sp. DL9XJH121]